MYENEKGDEVDIDGIDAYTLENGYSHKPLRIDSILEYPRLISLFSENDLPYFLLMDNSMLG